MFEQVEKQANSQRQVPPLRKHGMNPDRRGGERIEHADQAALDDVIADFPPRAPREAVSGETPLVQHGAVRAFHRARYAHLHDLAVLLKHPAALLIRARPERQAGVLRELVEIGGCATAAQILRRCHANRRFSPSFNDTSDESGNSPSRTAQSKPSLTRSTIRSVRSSVIDTSGCIEVKTGTSAAT